MSILEPTPLELAKSRRDEYRKAEAAILGGAQEYTIGSGATARRIRRAELADIVASITAIDAQILQLDAAAVPAARRRRVMYLRPR
jgi:hypothetical protein